MARRFALIAGAVSLALTAPSASAAADTPRALAVQGVWQGTLGTQPIRACFNNRETDSFGAYFYLSKLVTIPLVKDDKGELLFSEGWPDDPKAPRWALTPIGADELAGTWKQGSRNLALRLTRVPLGKLGEDDSPCGSMAFEQPRLNGIHIVRTRAAKDGVGYAKLTLELRGHFPSVSVESFQLDGHGSAVERINRVLDKPFAKDNEESWLGCVRSSFNSSPWGAEHNESFELQLITRKWLAVNHHWDGFCGGAHPDSSNSPRLFDLTSGAEINLFDWFNDKAVKREHLGGEAGNIVTIRPAFQKMLMAGWKGDDECRDAIAGQDFWSVALTRSGFSLTPSLPHVVQACTEDFNLSFARAAPYLNATGKREVEAFNRR